MLNPLSTAFDRYPVNVLSQAVPGTDDIVLIDDSGVVADSDLTMWRTGFATATPTGTEAARPTSRGWCSVI
ncbi:MAG: hypothetical protein V5A33_07245 [Halobacteriales archaeon]|jgi:hypothetical protein